MVMCLQSGHLGLGSQLLCHNKWRSHNCTFYCCALFTVPCQIPTSKINEEASRKSEVTLTPIHYFLVVPTHLPVLWSSFQQHSPPLWHLHIHQPACQGLPALPCLTICTSYGGNGDHSPVMLCFIITSLSNGNCCCNLWITCKDEW